MIIKRTIKLALDVKNMLSVYSDPDNNIKAILSRELVGRCYSQCLILSIDSIDRRSECVITRSNEPNFGTISVVFTVSAIVINPGEIINGLVVKHVDTNGILLAGSEYISCIMRLGPGLTSIKPGQIISCRAVQFSYEIAKDKIAVYATPMLQKHTAETYKINKHDLDSGVVTDWIERCKHEEIQIEELKVNNATAIEKFSKLLYTYKEFKPVPKDAKNIIELLSGDFKTIYVTRDPVIDLTTPMANVVSTAPANVSIVKSTAGAVAVLSDYHDMLKCVREMIEIYNTKELLLEHENLWRIFNKNKLD
jgi:hypothetical protein